MARKAKPKINPAFTPRMRFNWGYHDAAHDHNRGRIRLIVNRIPDGENPTRYVLAQYDPDYTQGYIEGESDALGGIYAENSEQAWRRTGYRARRLFGG